MLDDFHKTAVLKTKKIVNLTQQRIVLTINGAALVPKFVLSLALDFPDICLQFFMGNFSRQEEKFLCRALYIFARLPTRQDGLQKRDYRYDSI